MFFFYRDGGGRLERKTSFKLKLEVLIEKGSAAASCDANRTKTVCRTVEHMNFFLKVNNIEL